MGLGLIDADSERLKVSCRDASRRRDRGRRRPRRRRADRRDRRPRRPPRRHRRGGGQRGHRDRRAAADGGRGDRRGDDRHQPARRLAHRPRGAAARAGAPRPRPDGRLGRGRAARRRARRLQRLEGRGRGPRTLAARGTQAARRQRRGRLLPVPRDADGRGGRPVTGVQDQQAPAAVADLAHVAARTRDRAHGDRDRETLARGRTPAVPARNHGRARRARQPAHRSPDGDLGVPMEEAFAAEAERIGAAAAAARGGAADCSVRSSPGTASCGSSDAAGWASSTRPSRRRSGVPSRSSSSPPSAPASPASASVSSPSRGSRPRSTTPNDAGRVRGRGRADGALYLAMRFVKGRPGAPRSAGPDARGEHRRAGRGGPGTRPRAPTRAPRRQARQRDGRGG